MLVPAWFLLNHVASGTFEVCEVLEDFLKKEWVQNHFLEYKASELISSHFDAPPEPMFQPTAYSPFEWKSVITRDRSLVTVIHRARNWAGLGWSVFNRRKVV